MTGSSTSSSPITQGKVLLSPKLIHPKTGTEIRKPDFPRLRYSHLDASTEALSWAGRSLEDISVVLQGYGGRQNSKKTKSNEAKDKFMYVLRK